jgi:hypothetical protein
MAMTRCKECGNEISTKATICQKCGAPITRTTGCAKFALGLIILVVLIGVFGSQIGERGSSSTSAPSSSPSPTVAAHPGTAPTTSPAWRYSTTVDKINNKPIIFDQLESDNSIDYGFPYGIQRMVLTIRKAPSDGTSVYVSMRKGQLICDISDGCAVKVRFDSAPAVTFTGRTPSDYSSDTLFLVPAQRFIASLRKAKKTVIEVVFYEHGAVQYEFNTDGFSWK